MSQVEVAFVIFDLFEIWRRSSRSPPPHNILTSIFQRTETNTMETIVKAKRLKSITEARFFLKNEKRIIICGALQNRYLFG